MGGCSGRQREKEWNLLGLADGNDAKVKMTMLVDGSLHSLRIFNKLLNTFISGLIKYLLNYHVIPMN